MAYVVTVNWQIKPEHLETFAEYAKQQAENSLKLEEECLHFDLLRSHDNSDKFFMYEIYKSQNAFDVHCASDHFANFSEAVMHMIVSKNICRFQML